MIRAFILLMFLASCGRPLTQNELLFAGDIMGDTLNYPKVRLHDGSPSRGVTMTRKARPRTTCRERILPPEKVGNPMQHTGQNAKKASFPLCHCTFLATPQTGKEARWRNTRTAQLFEGVSVNYRHLGPPARVDRWF